MLGIVISSTLVALPGIGSKTAIALLLPLAFTLDKFEAICLIVSVWAVSNTANSITSILFAVPGGSGSQATILDGYPMARNGEASRALSAAFTSSALGGIFGAIVLAISLPVLKPLVILLGPPEFFVLILFGIAMVSTLSGKNSEGARDWYPRSSDLFGWDPLGQWDTEVHFRQPDTDGWTQPHTGHDRSVRHPRIDLTGRLRVVYIKNGA